MILNERQYRTTYSHLRRFQKAAEDLASEPLEPIEDAAERRQLHLDSLLAQAAELADQISEYERLRSGEERFIEARGVAGLADLLIRGRIARGWTQRDLATALGLREQQVQQYEASRYRSASLTRVQEVADALGLEVVETAEVKA